MSSRLSGIMCGSVLKGRESLMKRRPLASVFIPGLLLVLGVLAIACGDDDGGADEDAIRDTIQEVIAACNEGDSARVGELETINRPGCPPNAPNDVEVLSVTVDGDEATVETIRSDIYGDRFEEPVVLRKERGRWLVHRMR